MLLVLSFATESDKEKFEYLYNTYKGLMIHKAHSILRDFLLAEDAVSEAFIRIYKNLDKITDPGSKKTMAFICTIVQNVSLTMLAKEKRQVIVPFEEDYQDDYNIEHHVLGEISGREIEKIVNELKVELREVFLLSYSYQLSHKEISEFLNISESNAKVRLHRAKKTLAKSLIEGGYIYEQAGQ